MPGTGVKRAFLVSFAVDSGYTIGRVVILLLQYSITPIVASRIGTIPLAAYSIMIGIYFFPTLWADSIGSACNVKGTSYLGKNIHSNYRRLVYYMPSISIITVSFGFCLSFYLLNDPIARLFTSDSLVLEQIDHALPIFLIVLCVGGLPGPFEGLCMAKQNFGYLFVSMVVGIFLFWLPISIYNLFWGRDFNLLWVSLLLLLWVRFLSTAVIIYWETWKEKDWKDGIAIGINSYQNLDNED